MKKILVLIFASVLLALPSKAESVKYTIIFDGVENTNDWEQSFFFRAYCSIVDPAWEILVSKDSNSFNELFLKVLREGFILEEDDPIKVLVEYVSDISFYFKYLGKDNRTYMGGSIEMPEKILLDIAHKYKLPSELEDAAFAREARRATFAKNNEKEIMERLIEVVSHIDINSFVSIENEKPIIQKLTSQEDFAECIYPRCYDFNKYILEQGEQISKQPNGQVNQQMKQKLLSWYNNSVGDYCVF